MIVTPSEMQAIESRAFGRGIEAETLMEEAGAKIAAAIRQFFPIPSTCLVYYGKGHNGGDALVAARVLAEGGWRIQLAELFGEDRLAPLTRKKRRELIFGLNPAGYDPTASPTIILDGLLGIGGRPGLHEPLRSATLTINDWRLRRGVTVFSIDLPTGLDGATGEVGPETVAADFTLTLGFTKRGLLADGAIHHVGRLAVLSLSGLESPTQGVETVSIPEKLVGLVPPRRFGTHKGECGRIGLIAGSPGLTGAAILSANAAIRAGAGLVSLFVPPEVYPLVAAQVMPEVMTRPYTDPLALLETDRFDALAIGPGLGTPAASEPFLTLIEQFEGPLILDADALNLLSAHDAPRRLRAAAGPRLLTPHPGEMARLYPDAAKLSRLETMRRFLQEATGAIPPVLLLKGARTLVGQQLPEGLQVAYNTTGTPAMAGGGMGDVLTGVCAALAGGGTPLYEVGRLGAWLTGRTAEIALTQGWRSQESLSAGDLGEFIGTAFRELRTGRYAETSAVV